MPRFSDLVMLVTLTGATLLLPTPAAAETEVAEVCFVNYGVKFPMFAPSSVTGAKANPVFRELARQAREPSWNFNKYLVSPEGKVVAVFGSSVKPESKELNAAIEKLL